MKSKLTSLLVVAVALASALGTAKFGTYGFFQG